MAAPSDCCSILFYLFIILSVCYIVVLVGEDEYEGLHSLTVEHTFDSGVDAVFIKRGIVTIRSLKSGMAEFLQDGSLSDTQKSKLKDLAQSDGLYRIRVGKGATDENSRPIFVYSFVKACALYESRLTDTLTIHIDHSGSLIATSISTPAPYCMGLPISSRDLNNFNTTVDVRQTVIGPVPETLAYIQKMEQEKIEKAKGQQGDNRSFFAKYWMYLVPLVIVMMLMNSVDPGAAAGGR